MNRACPACGVDIGHRGPQATHCSNACYQWTRKRPGVPRPSRECVACGASLAGRHPNTKACDKNCGHWALRHPGILRPSGVCQICLDPIDPSVEWPDSGSKSLDHIVPVSRGGAHSMSNVRAAHLGCNCRKGAKVDAVEGADGG